MRKIVEFDQQNFQKYVEVNQSFAQRLPEVRDIQSFVDLQREYGETVWSNTTEALQARGEMVREAAEANGEVLKSAFSSAQAEAKAPAKKAEKAAA